MNHTALVVDLTRALEVVRARAGAAHDLACDALGGEHVDRRRDLLEHGVDLGLAFGVLTYVLRGALIGL